MTRVRRIAFAVSYLRSIELRLNLNDHETYDAIAERYLTRLIQHAFKTRPAHIDKVVALTIVPTTTPPPQAPILAAPAQAPNHDYAITGVWSMRLSKALRYWSEQRRPGTSAITEVARSVSHFIAPFGDLFVDSITRPQVIEFRNLVSDMPPRSNS